MIAKLHADFVHVLALPEIKERFRVDGIDPIGGTPEHFATYIHDELVRRAQVAQAAGIQPE